MANSGPDRPDYTARPGEAVRVFRTGADGFAIGAGRIVIDSTDARFVGDVVADLGRLVHTPAGEAVLREGDALGRPVVIIAPDPPTEPPNAWIIPEDLAAATAAGIALARGGSEGRAGSGTGTGCGSTIAYRPADWPPGEPGSPPSDAVLLMMLRQANRNAAGRSDPNLPDWGDAE